MGSELLLYRHRVLLDGRVDDVLCDGEHIFSIDMGALGEDVTERLDRETVEYCNRAHAILRELEWIGYEPRTISVQRRKK